MERYDYKEIGEFINIGTGIDVTIKELAELVKRIVGYEGEIRHDLTKPDGTPKKLLDVSRLQSLGWSAKTNLAKGIQKTYEFFVGANR